MPNIDAVKVIDFTQCGDERGKLVAIEGGVDIPFEIKRAFYIYGSAQDVVRGQHANRKTEFVLINVSGTSRVKLKDGKGREMDFCLDKPYVGLYIPAMVWKDMYNFSQDSVLLALASEHYDAEEYIRDYGVFANEIGNN